MSQHRHNFALFNSALRRYRCTDPTCNVVGYASATRRLITPYACQFELEGRKHCGKDAVHVSALRSSHRCADHAPPVPTQISEAS